jgi:hypothetical protein
MIRQHQPHGAFAVEDPQTPEGIEARRLADRFEALDTRADEIEQEAREAWGAQRDAQHALREHLRESALEGKPPAREKALTDAMRKADATAAEPWGARIEAAREASSRAYQDMQRHLAEHGPALLEEFRDEAEAACERVEAAVAEIRAALGQWHDTANRVGALVAHIPGLTGQDVQRGDFATDIQRSLARLEVNGDEIPAPFVTGAGAQFAHTGERPTYDPIPF